MKKKIQNRMVFFVPEKVHLLDLSGPAQVFYEAKNIGASLEVLFTSYNQNKTISSSAGLSFTNLTDIESLKLDSHDYLFIPGNENIEQVIARNISFLNLIKKWYDEGVNICSICVGVFWLAATGIIDNKKATTHWKYLELLKKKHPEIVVQKNNLFVVEDKLYMSAGVSSGIDLSLFIIEKLYGYDLTLNVSREIVYYLRRTGSDPQISAFLKYRNHIDDGIHKAQDFIVKNIHEKITLNDIAYEVNMSKRNLSRKFKKTTDVTVGKYIEAVRIERIKHLQSKGMKMELIAQECGLRSVNHIRSLLNKYPKNMSS